MNVVWLMRHGEAQKAPGQSEADLFSIGDLGLSPRGLAQARAAADALAREPIEAVYASPLRRAIETARIVAAPHRLEVQVYARLRELPMAGTSYDEVLAAILDLPHRFREDGAMFADERRAFAEAIGEIGARHRSALVVAHGLANRAFLCAARGLPLSELLAIEQEHAAITRCEQDGAGWRA